MSKYKTGDKFVVEVESDSDTSELYKIKGVSSTVNVSILDDLQKYNDPSNSDRSFEAGIQFAQETYRKLKELSGFEISEIFNVDGGSIWAVIQKYTVKEINEMIENYNPNIKPGDCFLISSKDGHHDEIFVSYIDPETDEYYYLSKTGKTGCIMKAKDFVLIVNKRLPERKLDVSDILKMIFS